MCCSQENITQGLSAPNGHKYNTDLTSVRRIRVINLHLPKKRLMMGVPEELLLSEQL